MLMVAVLMWQTGDRNPAGTVLLFVGRWIYLVPLALLAWIARRRNRVMFLPLGLTTAVILFPVMGLTLGVRRLWFAPSGTPIRVVTFNTAAADSVTDNLPGLLARWQPDIVAFQECSPGLAAALAGLAGWHAHVERPLCLLSRYPITVAQPMDRTSLERVRTEGLSGAGGAGYVVRYVLQTPAGPVGFTNLHLETARKGLETLLGSTDLALIRENSELRDIEGERARAWVDAGLVPMIVAGDFNAAREGRAFRDHWGDLGNAFSRVGWGFGATRLNGWIRIRIDHVLFGTGLAAVRARVGEDAYSDHRPLIVDLRRLERIVE